eukprot:m.172841 g.172841  ORF g.172841 m.172841 type:complete len:1098 (+) comp13591_c0_seq1:68-3361(+)
MSMWGQQGQGGYGQPPPNNGFNNGGTSNSGPPPMQPPPGGQPQYAQPPGAAANGGGGGGPANGYGPPPGGDNGPPGGYGQPPPSMSQSPAGPPMGGGGGGPGGPAPPSGGGRGGRYPAPPGGGGGPPPLQQQQQQPQYGAPSPSSSQSAGRAPYPPPSTSQPPGAYATPPPTSQPPGGYGTPPSTSQPPGQPYQPPPPGSAGGGHPAQPPPLQPPPPSQPQPQPQHQSYQQQQQPPYGQQPQQQQPPYGQQPPGPPTMGGGPPPPPQGMQHQQQPMQPHSGMQRPGPGRYARPGMPPPPQAGPGGGGGMPPGMPGMQQGMGPPGVVPPAQAPRPRGIDPDAVPSPVAVEAADIEKYAKQTYSTSSKLVPPLPNTPAGIVDDGNCSPRVMRSSMYVVPTNKDLLDAMGIPLTLVIQPLADPGTGQPVPRVDHGPDGPIRCSRCKAYVNPGMVFSDGGRRYRCNFCDVESIVPERYFSNLDGAGQRHDLHARPELTCGTVDYVATQVYCQRPPAPASYLFVIDVTHGSVKNGLVAAAANAIQSVLDHFPPETRIGIITFGGGIQFYNLTAGLGQPQMMVMTDVGQPFVPLKTGLFVRVSESREIIESLLAQLPHMFEHTKAIDSFFGSAIDAATQAMEGVGGRMIVFSSSFPTVGPGALKAREDFKMLGTDQEKQLFAPLNQWYPGKAAECVKSGIAIDLFMCQSSGYADVASIGMLAHRTGGTIYRSYGFQSHLHAEKMQHDLRRIITRVHGFDAMMRVRTSLGLRPVEFYGAFSMSNTRDIEFAGIDEDKSVVLECRYDDKLSEQNGASFQAALLYTTATGERLIRVHTLMLGVGNQIADVFRATDMPVIINAVTRHALRETRTVDLKDLRDQLRQRCIRILGAYRKHCAGPNSPAGQLILPDCLKLLPLYTGCLCKLDALRGGGTVNADDRMTAMLQIMSMPIDKFLVLLYPQLYQIDDMVPQEDGIPDQIRPSYMRLKPHAAYLLENGRQILIWVGSNVSPSIVQKMLGAPSVQAIDTKVSKLPQTGDPLNDRLARLIALLRDKRDYYMPLKIVKQKDPTEIDMVVRLVEDKTNEAMSYVDFLCAIHRDIQNYLS